jgi:antitoxin Phd
MLDLAGLAILAIIANVEVCDDHQVFSRSPEPVAITRHGRPAAFVISTQDMDSFRDLREEKRRRLAEDWEEWRKQARAGMTAEAGALTEEEIVRMVHELR